MVDLKRLENVHLCHRIIVMKMLTVTGKTRENRQKPAKICRILPELPVTWLTW
jgi:hypothetical protein